MKSILEMLATICHNPNCTFETRMRASLMHTTLRMRGATLSEVFKGLVR